MYYISMEKTLVNSISNISNCWLRKFSVVLFQKFKKVQSNNNSCRFGIYKKRCLTNYLLSIFNFSCPEIEACNMLWNFVIFWKRRNTITCSLTLSKLKKKKTILFLAEIFSTNKKAKSLSNFTLCDEKSAMTSRN